MPEKNGNGSKVVSWLLGLFATLLITLFTVGVGKLKAVEDVNTRQDLTLQYSRFVDSMQTIENANTRAQLHVLISKVDSVLHPPQRERNGGR